MDIQTAQGANGRCDDRRAVCDERFTRDKERIGELEMSGRSTAELLAATAVTLDRVSRQLDDHESRIREIEKKPARRLDGIVTAIISAVAGIVVGLLFSGRYGG